MALYQQATSTYNNDSKSNTGLIKSPGDAPAVDYIIDESLPGLFSYTYAVARRLSMVVIPKGTIIALNGVAKDYNTGKYKNVCTFADGTTTKLPVGVAPYNFFRRYEADGVTVAHDLFGADDFRPAIITREYVQVPFIPNPADVYTYQGGVALSNVNGMKFQYGCATNITKVAAGSSTGLQPGDFVKPGPYGKFVKFAVGVDDPSLKVGQVLELDTDTPPAGWLQYVEPLYEGRDSYRENIPAEPAPSTGARIYDTDYVLPYSPEDIGRNRIGAWHAVGLGIPGLTDGANIAATQRYEHYTIGNANLTQTYALDPIGVIDASTLAVTVDGTAVLPGAATPVAPYYTYSAASQTLTITLDQSYNTKLVEIIYKVDPTTTIGTPASWDFVGAIGVANILLKF